MKIKDIIIKLLILSLCFLFVYLLFHFLLFVSINLGIASIKNNNIMYVRGQGGGSLERLDDIKLTKNIDILFLGASHTYRGFDPRIFAKNNIKIFNLGSSIQTPEITEILLDKYLEVLKPKLVIYEVYPNIFMKDNVEAALDIISNDDVDKYSFKMAIKANDLLVYNTLMYSFFSQYYQNNDIISKNKDTSDTYISGGYVEKKIFFYKNNDTIKIKRWEPLDYQIKAFDNIINKLKQNNIGVILVYAPTTNRNYVSFNPIEKINNFFKSRAEYYDFNKILGLNDTIHFYDYSHLNQYGVEIFNNKLIEVLDIKNRINNYE